MLEIIKIDKKEAICIISKDSGQFFQFLNVSGRSQKNTQYVNRIELIQGIGKYKIVFYGQYYLREDIKAIIQLLKIKPGLTFFIFKDKQYKNFILL